MQPNFTANSEISQVIEELETERKKIVSASIRLWIVIGIGTVLALLFVNYLIVAFITLGTTITYGLINFNRTAGAKTQYKLRYKQKVIRALLNDFGENLRFSPNNGISESEFIHSQLFKTQPHRYHTEDLIAGKIEKTSFYFAEVHAEYKTETRTKHGRQEHWHDILKGVVFVADFNKHFNGITVVRPKDIGASLGAWFSEHIYSFNDRELVTLEDEQFEKNFVTYSSDQVEARYILTPALMQRINELNRRSAYCISLSFTGSQVYIAFPLDHNYFEPPFFKSLLKPDLLESDLNILQFMFGIIKELDLNTRIWTKA